jgi:hypothetical protein
MIEKIKVRFFGESAEFCCMFGMAMALWTGHVAFAFLFLYAGIRLNITNDFVMLSENEEEIISGLKSSE